MTWGACDSGDRLKDELKDFIETWILDEGYKPRLPDEHIHVIKQGEEQSAGVNIVLVTERDTQRTWPYIPGSGEDVGKVVIEEYHLIAIVVKADKVSGGVPSVTAVHSVLRSVFSSPENTPERTDLVSRGVYNVFEAQDASVDVKPGADDEEGTFFSKVLSLECSTDMLSK